MNINDKINWKALNSRYGYNKRVGVLNCTPLNGRTATDVANNYSIIDYKLCIKHGIRL